MERCCRVIVSFEGVDGAGKSALLAALKDYYREFEDKFFESFRKVRVVREPGGCAFSESVRGLLLDRKEPLDYYTQFLLFSACRREMVLELEGKGEFSPDSLIIFDRYIDSTFVYQRRVREMVGIRCFLDLIGMSCKGHFPDLTFVITASFDNVQKRIADRGSSANAMDGISRELYRQLSGEYSNLPEWRIGREVIYISNDCRMEDSVILVAGHLENFLSRRLGRAYEKVSG